MSFAAASFNKSFYSISGRIFRKDGKGGDEWLIEIMKVAVSVVGMCVG